MMGKGGGGENEEEEIKKPTLVLKKGPWTRDEDEKLLDYILHYGHGSWRSLPAKAGLQRCGKSCRLRWTNYLRPDIKRGKFSFQEQQTIIQLHALLGNRWSAIATHLPKRTDNEIKNYWNTHLKKRLTKMGIDPMTHKPKSSGPQSKDIANITHMAQWESARLQAEARLGRDSSSSSNSKMMIARYTASTTPSFQSQLGSAHTARLLHKPPLNPLRLDILKAWQGAGAWPKPILESPNSTLSFSENVVPLPPSNIGFGDIMPTRFNVGSVFEDKTVKQVVQSGVEDVVTTTTDAAACFIEGLPDLLVDNLSNNTGTLDNVIGNFDVNKNYWDSILYVGNNSEVSDSAVF